MTHSTLPDILIVDDSSVIRMIFSRAMKARGFTVVETAASGEEAIEILKNRTFGLILVDLLMPGIDGIEVCRWLSTHPQRSTFKVVVCSGCDELDVVPNVMSAGADAYFVKEGKQESFAERLSGLFQELYSRDINKPE
jgi:CheY-like chemotaxis protein